MDHVWVCDLVRRFSSLDLSTTGFYEPLRLAINRSIGRSSTDQIPWTSIAAGAISGAVGGMQ